MQKTGAILLVVSMMAGPLSAGEPEIGKLELLRYSELTKIVRSQHDKIVLVDFWAEFCPPCKREFPNFVRLAKKFPARDFLAISVSVDDPEDRIAIGRAEKFLKDQAASSRNFLLNEKVEVWQQKLKIDGPPCVFLFDREGKLVNRWAGGEIDYLRIEKRIRELLDK